MIERLLKITLRLEYLEGVGATEKDKSSIWERKELERERNRLMPDANIQYMFLKASHPSRFQ